MTPGPAPRGCGPSALLVSVAVFIPGGENGNTVMKIPVSAPQRVSLLNYSQIIGTPPGWGHLGERMYRQDALVPRAGSPIRTCFESDLNVMSTFPTWHETHHRIPRGCAGRSPWRVLGASPSPAPARPTGRSPRLCPQNTPGSERPSRRALPAAGPNHDHARLTSRSGLPTGVHGQRARPRGLLTCKSATLSLSAGTCSGRPCHSG